MKPLSHIVWRALHGKPKFLIENKGNIIPAFISGDVQYYQYEDPLNTSYRRGFAALAYYEELRMRTTREFLLLHTQANRELHKQIKDSFSIKDGRLNLSLPFDFIKKLELFNNQLEERLEMIYEPDIIFKLGSVVFFDVTENPAVYDFKYGAKKIARWKKEQSVEDFFLSTPMQQLIPHLKESVESSPNYSKAVQEVTAIHLANLSKVLSKAESTNDNGKKSPSPDGFHPNSILKD